MRKFTHIDEAFQCAICKEQIPPLGYTARDHCRHCLHSLHLDINPGDRSSTCGGVLLPVSLEPHRKKSGVLQIVYKCEKCGVVRKNIVADDDDYNAILALQTRKVFENA